MASNRRQDIICHYLKHWRIYAALGEDGITLFRSIMIILTHAYHVNFSIQLWSPYKLIALGPSTLSTAPAPPPPPPPPIYVWQLYVSSRIMKDDYNMIAVFFSPVSIDSSPASTDLSPASTDSSLLAFLLLEPSPPTIKNISSKKMYFLILISSFLFHRFEITQSRNIQQCPECIFSLKYSQHQSKTIPGSIQCHRLSTVNHSLWQEPAKCC